jgi:sRNA-binding regulator protein Hfq
MEIEQAQFEEQLGKPVAQLNRTEAKDWIKRLRLMADEVAPSGRVRFGQWPGSKEDQEASYLEKQRDAGTTFDFKLFNGEVHTGKIVDFTPYTVTLKTDGEGQEMVLRKLAIMYYRQQPGQTVSPDPHPHDHPNNDLGSDRVGEPEAPEADSMDEDRGV